MPLRIRIGRRKNAKVLEGNKDDVQRKQPFPSIPGEYEWKPVREVREGDNEDGSIYQIYEWVKKKLSKSG